MREAKWPAVLVSTVLLLAGGACGGRSGARPISADADADAGDSDSADASDSSPDVPSVDPTDPVDPIDSIVNACQSACEWLEGCGLPAGTCFEGCEQISAGARPEIPAGCAEAYDAYAACLNDAGCGVGILECTEFITELGERCQ